MIYVSIFSRIIKLSSPNLSNIIAVGAILCYASVMLLDRYANVTTTDGLITVVACLVSVWVFLDRVTFSIYKHIDYTVLINLYCWLYGIQSVLNDVINKLSSHF